MAQHGRRLMTIDMKKMSRKTFLASTAAGLLALTRRARAGGTTAMSTPSAKPSGAPPPTAIHYAVLKPSEWDAQKFAATIKTRKPHKVVYQAAAPHLIVPGMASL